MEKHELSQHLNIHLDKMLYLLHHQDDKLFNKEILEGKWTTAQHISHLIKSMAAVNKAMKMPKFLLQYKFGLNNRNERNFEALLLKYEDRLQQSTALAPSRFQPNSNTVFNKTALIKALQVETEKMITTFHKWHESQLSKYILPHPLLGKLTIREMIMFSIIHMDHHRMILKEKYSDKEVRI